MRRMCNSSDDGRRVVRDINWFSQWVRKTDTCWEWMGRRSKSGYGYFTIRTMTKRITKSLTWRAHRYSYVLYVGQIPVGLLVCHRCDNPKCVRPDHLFLGTHKDNAQDRDRKGRKHYPIGEDNPMATISNETARIIKTMLKDGRRNMDIVKQLSVPKYIVENIKSGGAFAWLTV